MFFAPIDPKLSNGPKGVSESLLRAGMRGQSTVQRDNNQLFVRFQGARIPLEAAWGMREGQSVQLEVLSHAGGLRVQLSQASSSNQAASADPGAASFASLFKELTAAFSPEKMRLLLPKLLLQKPSLVQQLFSLLGDRGAFSADLQVLHQQLGAFLNTPGVEHPAIEALFGLLSSWAGDLTAPALKKDLLNWARSQALEARLARATAPEGILKELNSLRVLLAQLSDDEAFVQWIGGQAGGAAFEAARDRLLHRAAAAQLQNLRALEGAYAFFELPCLPESGLTHAQLHCFYEDARKGNAQKKDRFMVAFDLSTTMLGDVWIALEAQAKRCRCHFKVAGAELLAPLREASGELRQALRDQGYESCQIQVSLQQQSAVEELEALLGRFRGLDLQA